MKNKKTILIICLFLIFNINSIFLYSENIVNNDVIDTQTNNKTLNNENKSLKMRIGLQMGTNVITGKMKKYSDETNMLYFLFYRMNLPFLDFPKVELESKIGYYKYKMDDPVLIGNDRKTEVTNLPIVLNSNFYIHRSNDFNLGLQFGYALNLMFMKMNDKTKANTISALTPGLFIDTEIGYNVNIGMSYTAYTVLDKELVKLFHQFLFGVHYALF